MSVPASPFSSLHQPRFDRSCSVVRLALGVLAFFLAAGGAFALTAPTVQRVAETISGTPNYGHHYVIKWQDNSNDEDIFQVRVQFDSGSFYTIAATLANNDYTTYDLPDSIAVQLRNNSALNFVVIACKATFTYYTEADGANLAGQIKSYTPTAFSGISNIMPVTFHASSSQALAAPTNLVVTAPDDGNINIAFNDNTDSEDGYQFLIKKTADTNYPTDHDSFLLPFSMNNYTARNSLFLYKVVSSTSATSGLEPGTSYKMKIRAVRIVNNAITATTGYSNEATVSIPALNAPTGFTAVPIDETKVSLLWTDNSKGEHGYLLQWKEEGAADSTFQAVTGTNPNVANYELKSSDLPGLMLPGYNLTWRIATAYNPASNTSGSAANYLTFPSTQLTTATKFNKPESLQATLTSDPANNGATNVSLTWQDKSSRETGYRVFGKTSDAANYSVLQDLSANTTATSFTINNPGTSYQIVVRGFYDSSGSILSLTDESNVVTLALKNAFTSKTDQLATVGQAFSYQVATSGAAQRIDLAVTGLPEGLTFNSANAQISGTPVDSGLFNITMTASFNDGWVVTAPLTLRVMVAEGAPTRPVVVTTRRLAPGATSTLALSDLFADKDTQEARRITTNKGDVDVVLYTSQTPATVANFKAYADANEYNGVVFHRNSPNFVLQGGGYKPTSAPNNFVEVTKRPSPVNEPGIPNVRGTLSLAKGGTPNSGSHDFFINLVDNRSILDENTGGFTVFGRVAGLQAAPSMTTAIDAILALPGLNTYTINLTPSGSTTVETGFNPIAGSGLGEGTKWPINDSTAPSTMDNTKMVTIDSISVLPVMSYEIVSAPDQNFATAAIENGNLVITGVAETTTATSLQIRATDVDGNQTLQDMTIDVDPLYLPINITQHPQTVIANLGDQVIFNVSANGTSPAYQWRRNGKDIPGANTATYVISSAAVASGGTYTVVVSNQQSRVISEAAVLTVHAPPSFTSPAVTQNLAQNWSATIKFSPVAVGDPTITYQWRKGSTDLTGKTSASLELTNLALSDAGSYVVRATNAYGFADSPAFVLVVNKIDTDGDGLTDDEELGLVPPTNRLDADSDDDGYSDGVEVTLGSNPNDVKSTPGATKFVASKDGAAVLAGLSFKRIPGQPLALFPDRLSAGIGVAVPDRWLATYELTNEQLATLLDYAMRTMDIIEVVDQGVRKGVRYPKTTGQILCYMATPAPADGEPPSTDLDFDPRSHTFTVPKALIKMPARGVNWYCAYVATMALNHKYGYTTMNVPASFGFDTSKKGFIIPSYVDWEWAARGGAASGFNGTTNLGYRYPTGANITPPLAKYNDLTPAAKPKNVGSYGASKLGLFDLAGNVAEWISNGDSTNAYVRGGSYLDSATTPSPLENNVHQLVSKTSIQSKIGIRLGLIESSQPAFLPNLSPQLVKVGATINLSISAAGAPPLTYQWYKNNVLMKGKTASSLSIPNAQLTDAGAYMVKVTGNGVTSSSTSNVAVMEVAVPTPTAYVVPNKKLKLAAKVATAPGQLLEYVWTLNGSSLNTAYFSGEMSTNLSMDLALPGLAGLYEFTAKLPQPDALFPPITTGTNVVVYDTPDVELAPSNLPYGVVGGTYSYNGQTGFQVPYNSNVSKVPTTWVITGLPPGMTYNKSTGVITGRPTKVGLFPVKIVASNPFNGSSVESVTIEVKDFPGIATGSYAGRIERHSVSTSSSAGVNDNLGGKLEFTTQPNGYYTATLMLGSGTYKYMAYLEPSVNTNGVVGNTLTSSAVVPRSGRLPVKISLSYDSTTNRFTGTVGEIGPGLTNPATTAVITGWRNKFNAGYTTVDDQRGGYHTFSLKPPAGQSDPVTVPQGSTFGSVNVSPLGSLAVAGRTADNTVYTTSGCMGPSGEVIVFGAFYGGKGSLFGTLNIGSATGHPVTVSPSVNWLRKDFGAGSKERSYERGFGPSGVPLNLEIIEGGAYATPAANTPVMGLTISDGPTPPAANNVQIDFTTGGIPTALNWPFRISKANLAVMPAGNTKLIDCKVDKTTGIFSGSFTLTDPDPTAPTKNVTRKSLYFGIITPSPVGASTGIGHGFFTLARLPNAPPDAHTKDTSDILSGKVILSKLAPAGP